LSFPTRRSSDLITEPTVPHHSFELQLSFCKGNIDIIINANCHFRNRQSVAAYSERSHRKFRINIVPQIPVPSSTNKPFLIFQLRKTFLKYGSAIVFGIKKSCPVTKFY